MTIKDPMGLCWSAGFICTCIYCQWVYLFFFFFLNSSSFKAPYIVLLFTHVKSFKVFKKTVYTAMTVNQIYDL